MSRKINVFYEAGDLDQFKSMLIKHPEYLRDDEGLDLWMWRAALRGRIEVLKLLVEELGLDVNLSADKFDPDDPFCHTEGPVVHAATEGHLEVVRWLLEHGAKINSIVNGKNRCLSLLRAAAKGHLDVVKLLVEHGADLSFSFNGHTPLSQAENYGHKEIAEYLRSKGAK